MAPRLPRSLLGAVAACHLAAAAAAASDAAQVSDAIAGDDECAAEGAGGCSLSAMQRRGVAAPAGVAGAAAERARLPSDPALKYTVDEETGELHGDFLLEKRYDLGRDPGADFDIASVTDEFLTHSCSNYIDDGSTVFSRDGKLVLKVGSGCDGGGCVNSGRIMSKTSYSYGLFTFSAKVPKCNHVWPAIWLLPGDVNGTGAYGTWPCSGEIDLLETVHGEGTGSFNLVAGYGTDSVGCYPSASTKCNKCDKTYCTSTTMKPTTKAGLNPYYVEPEKDCESSVAGQSWEEHTFVLNWQPNEVTVWVDPIMKWDGRGHIVSLTPKLTEGTNVTEWPTWKTYRRPSTPTWQAVDLYMNRCFPDQFTRSAPFDIGFKIVLNIAVGGYGGAPCSWGKDTCSSVCGQAVGSELVLSDISVWQKA